MKKRKIFKPLAFFFLFLFVFLLNVRLVKAQDNGGKLCRLKKSDVDSNLIQYFQPESQICASSLTDYNLDIIINFSSDYSSLNHYEAAISDDDILNISYISDISDDGGINVNTVLDILRTYYKCNNDGKWEKVTISENNKYCKMPDDFNWFSPCNVGEGGDSNCKEENAGLIKVKILDIPEQGKQTESLESKPSGVIPCYSGIGAEEASELADVEELSDLENEGEAVDLLKIRFTDKENENENEWGCFHINTFIISTGVCLSDLIAKAHFAINDYLNRHGLSSLKNNVACPEGYKPSNVDDPSCYCVKENKKPEEISNRLCSKYIDGKEFNDCSNCFSGTGYWSALGCIKFSNQKIFFEMIFSFLIGLAGIIALFCIIYAAFQLQLSQGSPEKIKKAQELITSCIMGLMIIIFSVFILKLIGVDILRIPTFR